MALTGPLLYVMLGHLATILCSCIMKVNFWKAMPAYVQQAAIPLLCLHLWRSPIRSCVFIWEVKSDILLSDSTSLPSVLLFFMQGTESFLLGCINIHVLVSPFSLSLSVLALGVLSELGGWRLEAVLPYSLLRCFFKSFACAWIFGILPSSSFS